MMALLQPSLHSLPFELIEEIIIITTVLGDTRAIATLSQTRRAFRALVYHQSHKYLWREIFLVVFDNPFLAHNAHTYELASLPHINPGEGKFRSHTSDVFPWEGEYKRRIWTESFILRRTRPPQDSASSSLPCSDVEVYTALQTLLRVISTAPPLPYDARVCMETYLFHLPSRDPVWPPLFDATRYHDTIVLGSRSVTWVARVLEYGLPHVLMARLNVFDEHGRVDVQKRPVKWDGLLAELVAQIGLAKSIPPTMVVPPLASIHSMWQGDNNGEGVTAGVTDIEGAPVEEGNGSDDDDILDDVPIAQSDLRSQEPQDVNPNSQPGSKSTSERGDEGIDDNHSLATQAMISLDGVRRLAYIRVYDIAHLHPSRNFGPYLPIDKRPISSTGFCVDREEDGGAEEGSSSTSVSPDPPISGSTFSLSPSNCDDANFSPGQGEEDDILSRGQLHVDWALIAAARVIIEPELYKMTRMLRAPTILGGLLPCSAPGFPLATPEWPAADGDGPGVEDGRLYRDGEGWDWAGVEGQWMRCVRYLLEINLRDNNWRPLAKRFAKGEHWHDDEFTQMIPCTFRISHYTRAPAAWPGRPTIHFIGETPEHELMSGTVVMAASGFVRWTLISFDSFYEIGGGEWVSEGVQLGGCGSAIGIIGIFTHAERNTGDPIGPFWAWKVGSASSLLPRDVNWRSHLDLQCT